MTATLYLQTEMKTKTSFLLSQPLAFDQLLIVILIILYFVM